MSLVNDMLRDLDKRKRLPPQAMRVNSVMDKHPPRSRIGSPWIAGIATLSVLAGLGGGYLMFREAPAATNAAAAVPISSVASAEAEPRQVVQTAEVQNAPANIMDIVRESENSAGFLLRIKTAEAVQYNIVSRDTYGITLHLDGIDNYASGAADLTGMSVLLESGGASIEIDLDAATDFKVFEDIDTPAFDIVLQASYRQAAMPAPAVAAIDQAISQSPQQQSPETQAVAAAAPGGDELPQAALSTDEHSVPVRITRELTLEQRDAIASRGAIALMQGGQLQEARRDLLAFIAENSEAHQSRATLATLLLAQQDMAQADSVVSQGLAMAPNFAPYKKIKARILLQQGDGPGALELLRELPPTVDEDTEYHEILASLYQQNNQHPLAVATYQELLRHDNRQGRWWMGMAVSLEAQGNGKDALNSFQAALQSGNLEGNLRQYSQNRIRALGEAAQ